MSFKSIYLALSGATETDAVAEAAFSLAETFNGHVIGSDTVTEPGPFLDQTGIGMMATYYDELYKSVEKVQAHKRSVASETFERARQKYGVEIKETPDIDRPSCYWHAHDGDPNVVARLGRLADIIVAAQPGEHSSHSNLQTLEQAIFDARRGVLMVPTDATFDPTAPAVIAWNGSTEAARALINATPLVNGAAKVILIQVGDLTPGSTEMSAAEAYLRLHGVKAEIKRVEKEKSSTSDLILSQCEDVGAGCLVMGAYTHNPWREMILGGVTQHMTQHASLPLLLAH